MNHDYLIPILSFLSVAAIGGAVVAARAMRRTQLQARLDEFSGGAAMGDSEDGPSWFAECLQKIGAAVAPSGPSKSLRERLAQAGYYAPASVALFMGAKVILFVAGLLGTLFLLVPIDLGLSTRALYIIGGATILMFIPNMIIDSKRRKRGREIRIHLPDAIDLLEISVSSGMGLDQSWNAVGEEIRKVSPILADEMALTNLEIHLGAERAAAMRHMAQRTGAEELSSLVAVLVQSEKFGTTVSEALRSFAEAMRETRTQKAEEEAEKMAVKLLFPMVVFVFPTILVVCAGPAGMKIVDIFGGS